MERRSFLSKILLAGAGSAVMLRSNALANIGTAFKNIAPGLTPEQIARDEDFWSTIQASFEIDRSMINFNNGGVSPSPLKVQHVFKEFLDYSNQSPSYKMWRHLEPNVELVRTKLARYFGCDPEETAITRNASEGLQIIQQGLNLKEGDEVLTTTQDYPRMLTTWDQLERRRGIKVKKVKFPVPLVDKHDFLSAIENGITRRTKVILVSHVIFLTGQILPIKEVSAIGHKHGIPVLCDGAHSFSHFPFKLKDLNCDFFGTSLHKWTYAPIGTGFLYVKKDLIPEVWPLMAAPESMDSNIRKFEEIGTHPAANHNAIAEALAFNEKLGVDRKAARFRYLHSRWTDRLKDFSNVEFQTSISDPANQCGIVNVNIKGIDVGKLASYLFRKHKIFVVAIKHDEFQGIRVSPNVYSLVSEIDYFGDVMEEVAKGNVEGLN